MLDLIGTAVDLTGQMFGHITFICPIKRHKTRGVIWECLCACGKTCEHAANRRTRVKVCSQTCVYFKPRQIDLRGLKFGHVTFLEPVGPAKKATVWRCQCDCGKIFERLNTNRKQINACDKYCKYSKKQLNLTGQRFGKIVFISPTNRASHWVAECDCGKVYVMNVHSRKKTNSCGCMRSERIKRAKETGRFKCKKHGDQLAVPSGDFFRCEICVNEHSRYYNQKNKLEYLDYLGDKCARCGYNDCIAALDFHHVDPTQKEFAIAGPRRPWEEIKLELDKCVVLCANCHRSLHYGDWSLEDVK